MASRSEDFNLHSLLINVVRAVLALGAAGAVAGSIAALSEAALPVVSGAGWPGSGATASAFAVPFEEVRPQLLLSPRAPPRALGGAPVLPEVGFWSPPPLLLPASVVLALTATASRRASGRHRSQPKWVVAATGTADSVAVNRRFTAKRWLTFTGMVVGYATYYLTRLSFSLVGPAMRKDLGLSILELGAVSSIFPLAYMNSKFIAGVLSDLLGSPALLFSVGMILTGICNILLSMGSTIPWFTFFWVANGLFQGCGGSPCGKMLVSWYPTATRGRWWSLWASSTTIGGVMIPLLAGAVAAQYGWRWGMRAPGIIAIAIGMISFFVVNDSPEKLGLPSAEDHYAAEMGLVPKQEAKAKVDSQKTSSAVPAKKQSMWDLMGNRFLWCLASMHFFVYFMRQGMTNWATFYLMDQYGLQPMEAAARFAGFEFGGFFGCIVSGLLSDTLISRNPGAGAAGMRARVMFLFMCIAPLALLSLWKLPPIPALQWFSLALLGFAVYGPVTLITMTGAETVPTSMAASAGGALSYPAQFGSMAAGLPFALIVRKLGWSGYFPSLILLSGLAAVSALPGWNAKSWAQQEAEAASRTRNP